VLPGSNQGVGENTGFPDVCNTPIGTGTAPITYPNFGSNGMGLPMTVNILLSFVPGHNQSAKPTMTNGDNAGVAHSSFMMSGGNNMGNVRVLMQGQPAETLTNPCQGNNYNCSSDAKLVPSVTNVLIGYTGDAEEALARELLDLPTGGLGLTTRARRRGPGRRVVHVRRDAPGARAGVRPGDVVVGASPPPAPGEPLVLDVERAGARGRLRARLGRPVSPVAARLLPDGVGQLVVRRCSAGAPTAAAAALDALAARGARAVVVDLRRNPGGAVAVADALGARLRAWPLAVLVDGQTASAAELLAARLQDTGRPVVGRPTFGKTAARPLGAPAARPVPLRRGGGAALTAVTPDVAADADAALAAARAVAQKTAGGRP